ncbi:hypothetical protein ACFQRB_16770 [Halobaculum litoreum]|uniref:AAA domain-containing protein n=1 Tax=Halobaculum litoreum TaxID=3031998 RepID=A0ABD5XUS9_9EURY
MVEFGGNLPSESTREYRYRAGLGVLQVRLLRHSDKLTWADGWRDGEDTRLFAITGPENTGKTTLLSQSIKLFVDEEFRKLLWTLPDADLQNLPSTDVSQLQAAWAIDKYHHATKPGDNEYTNLVQQLPEARS